MPSNQINAILLQNKDNVITTIDSITRGEQVYYQKEGKTLDIRVVDDIPRFHKISLVEIQPREPVYKYGELIGEASRYIPQGSHVHDHNIRSPQR